MALEHPPHRCLGVPNSPLGLGDLHDAWVRPEVGGEPVGERSLREHLGESGLVVLRHQRGPAGPRDGAQRRGAPSSRALFQ